MSDVVRARKPRKYNLSNVSKIQDIPPQGEIVAESVLYHPDRFENRPQEREYRIGGSIVEKDVSSPFEIDHLKHPQFMSEEIIEPTDALDTIESQVISNTSELFHSQRIDLPRFRNQDTPGFKPVEREARQSPKPEPRPMRDAAPIQKAQVDVVNVAPVISISKVETSASHDNPKVVSDPRLEHAKSKIDPAIGNIKVAEPLLSSVSIGENISKDEQPLGFPRIGNTFSFQDSPPLRNPTEIVEKSHLIPHLIQQATFGIGPNGTCQLDELIQSVKSYSSPLNKNTLDYMKSPPTSEADVSPLQKATIQSLNQFDVKEAAHSHKNTESLHNQPLPFNEISTLQVPQGAGILQSNEAQLNQHIVRLPSENSPVSPEGKANAANLISPEPNVRNPQISFGASPNLGSPGPFNKIATQPIIEMKPTTTQPPTHLPKTADFKAPETESPANTSKSVPINHPKHQVHTHASLPGRTPTSAEDKSPSIPPSERELSVKLSKSVKGEQGGPKDNNLEKMRRMLDHSLKSGGVTKRSGSYIEIDDAKSSKSFINEDKMKRRIKEQFPTNEIFLDNNSAKSGELNAQQVNYTQRKQQNQIIDSKVLKAKIVRGESHNIHQHHSHHHPLTSQEGSVHDHLPAIPEKPLFTHVYPKLAVVMISLLFVEILRKLLAN